MNLSSEPRWSEPEHDDGPWQGLLDGRYRCVGRLGGGGMGEVYEVEHVRLQRRFALKLLRPELKSDRELMQRFDREARAVATLHSDYVVSIVDSGTLPDGRPYFVMERLLGQDLRQLLASGGPLPIPRAVNIAIDLCLGLHAAHAAGLVHRDLKPENVFVTRSDDGRERCKLLDFGVVKVGEQDHTRPGVLVGTARYMAPEQVAHGSAVSAQADLFALGVILYRCLSGQHPFAADSLERVLYRIMNETPAALHELVPHVPPELSALVARTLAKAPSERPSSAIELGRGLDAFAGETRNLGGVEGWRVETTLSGDVASDRLTPAEATPALLDEAPTARPAPRRWPALVGGAVLLVLLTASIDRLLLAPRLAGPSPATTDRTEAAAPAPAPLPTIEPPPPVASTPELDAPVLVETPARAQKAARPIDRAAPTPPSSARPSVNWFDPRNPYGE